ncbi:hypothetical protein [Streptomyces sp. Je 1-369]|uniref:hypothetical protein n=1 Tax=Streptomyces sp. Je 1-369 TaxID=2966192 RepID=UPI002285E168|nr:hypothetical protein [Streptomyces sp. Je 1-369]WAL93216.1 hypothetical protein NOO62_01110 [Streptomyces sp. Je 1-369]
MSQKATRTRGGLTRLIHVVVDEVQDIVESALDRVDDAEKDFRRGLTRLVESRDHSAGDGVESVPDAGLADSSQSASRGASD